MAFLFKQNTLSFYKKDNKTRPSSSSSLDDWFAAKYIHLEKLTSRVYGTHNPPKDWADVSLLVPHETIRREMQHMLISVQKLEQRLQNKTLQSWQLLYFCEWYVDIFEPFVHSHHDAEEFIYFPWIGKKAAIPKKKYSQDHGELLSTMRDISTVCNKIFMKKGEINNCRELIVKLKQLVTIFVDDMNEHLEEEEREVPPLLRKHFTKKEDEAIVQKILQSAPIRELRTAFPAIYTSTCEWGTQEFVKEEMLSKIPRPIQYLANNYYIPDYKTCIAPKRDAPLLEERPSLEAKKCFGVCFFSCLV